MIVWVVAGGILGEAAGRTVLEPLVDRKDDQLTGAAEPAMHEDAREIGFCPRAVALVVGQDFFDALRNSHQGCSLIYRW